MITSSPVKTGVELETTSGAVAGVAIDEVCVPGDAAFGCDTGSCHSILRAGPSGNF